MQLGDAGRPDVPHRGGLQPAGRMEAEGSRSAKRLLPRGNPPVLLHRPRGHRPGMARTGHAGALVAPGEGRPCPAHSPTLAAGLPGLLQGAVGRELSFWGVAEQQRRLDGTLAVPPVTAARRGQAEPAPSSPVPGLGCAARHGGGRQALPPLPPPLPCAPRCRELPPRSSSRPSPAAGAGSGRAALSRSSSVPPALLLFPAGSGQGR